MTIPEIVGYRVKTRYGSGGIVNWVSNGPDRRYHDDGTWTIHYESPCSDGFCELFKISEIDGVIYHEGHPLIIKAAIQEQLSLF